MMAIIELEMVVLPLAKSNLISHAQVENLHFVNLIDHNHQIHNHQLHNLVTI